jgi:hypothetical protein
MIDLKNKKVLLMGLGILGGGVATAKWLLKQGVNLTITDVKDKDYLVSSLEKLEEFGDKINFVGIDEKGEKGGMVSEIAESRKPEYISIRHLGYMQNGVEDTTSEAVKAWAPAYENYTIQKDGEGSKFILEQDIEDQYEEMFAEMWPKAFQKIKEIAERE